MAVLLEKVTGKNGNFWFKSKFRTENEFCERKKVAQKGTI